MLKALLFELLKSRMVEERKSYAKPFVYFFNILGLSLLIIAKYNYWPDTREFTFFINGAILCIAIAIIIECIRCYLKCKNRYKTINSLKSSSRDLADKATTQVARLFTSDSVARCVPIIIRYVPGTILTFLICAYIKRKFAKNITYPLLGKWVK
ncbi:hypothetical protein [Rickettsia endosymbiont of Halotydeus destructor]|uniref:hypothetical protein n=1 Tax=Rickettsia endosymbiont of Halotydeus destructor TaxID=2996754 RepID=UPI003BAFD1CD